MRCAPVRPRRQSVEGPAASAWHAANRQPPSPPTIARNKAEEHSLRCAPLTTGLAGSVEELRTSPNPIHVRQTCRVQIDWEPESNQCIFGRYRDSCGSMLPPPRSSAQPVPNSIFPSAHASTVHLDRKSTRLNSSHLGI